jgi:hypothetical protein
MMDHYFVTCQDAGKTALLLGPFTDEDTCKKYAYGDESQMVRDACIKIDQKAHFYAFGMVKVANTEKDHFTGILNKLYPDEWDGVLA